MQEAKYSLNLRYNLNGYDSQLTLRSDENCQELFDKQLRICEVLGKLGAVPERRWENNRNGKPSTPKDEKPTPAPSLGDNPKTGKGEAKCVKCGSTNLELIVWQKNGGGKALKCQACGAWQPSPKKS